MRAVDSNAAHQNRKRLREDDGKQEEQDDTLKTLLNANGPDGKSIVLAIDGASTFSQLQILLATEFRLKLEETEVLTGYPPKLCNYSPSVQVSAFLKNHSTVLVRKRPSRVSIESIFGEIWWDPQQKLKADKAKEYGAAPGTWYTDGQKTWLGKVGEKEEGEQGLFGTTGTDPKAIHVKGMDRNISLEKISSDLYMLLGSEFGSEFGSAAFTVPYTRLTYLPFINDINRVNIAKNHVIWLHNALCGGEWICAKESCLKRNKYSSPQRAANGDPIFEDQECLACGTEDTTYPVPPPLPTASASGIHFLSQLVDGYRDLKQGFSFKRNEQDKIIGVPEYIVVDGKEVPLAGLVELLAASRLLGDIDVVGGDLKNAGFVLETGPKGAQIARVVKIDPGYAFRFNDETLDTQATQMGITIAAPNHMLPFEAFSPQQQKLFLECLVGGANLLSRSDVLYCTFNRHGLVRSSTDERLIKYEKLGKFVRLLKQNVFFQLSCYATPIAELGLQNVASASKIPLVMSSRPPLSVGSACAAFQAKLIKDWAIFKHPLVKELREKACGTSSGQMHGFMDAESALIQMVGESRKISHSSSENLRVVAAGITSSRQKKGGPDTTPSSEEKKKPYASLEDLAEAVIETVKLARELKMSTMQEVDPADFVHQAHFILNLPKIWKEESAAIIADCPGDPTLLKSQEDLDNGLRLAFREEFSDLSLLGFPTTKNDVYKMLADIRTRDSGATPVLQRSRNTRLLKLCLWFDSVEYTVPQLSTF
eukprot:gb/GEZN01001699.1/.p1 GENE.gb/GEZN01001699.1/~~gb/GEZN01001699.1/.p1  ORF type:complete len:814 (+),score=75.13 gb/GEZN01001699.1/:150-2444(+)